jgi:RNAse (barnase) inhibitor barstar
MKNFTPLRVQLVRIMDAEQEEKRQAIACIIDYKEQHGADINTLFDTAYLLWNSPLDMVFKELTTILEALHEELKNPLKRR